MTCRSWPYSPRVALRPVGDADEPFLRALYASTRAAEMALVNWGQAEQESFLAMQFQAQHRYYVETFPAAEFQMIQLDGRPIGRLYVDRRRDEIRILDITLAPEQRNRGIGTSLLRDLIAEAAQAGKPVRLCVEILNPARRLYERLGFLKSEDQGVYSLLEWHPGRQVKTAS